MQLNCEDLSEEIIYSIESGISICKTEDELLNVFVAAMKNFRGKGKITKYQYERCEIGETYKTVTFSYQPNIKEFIDKNNSIRKIVLVGTKANNKRSISEMLKEISIDIPKKEEKNKAYKDLSSEMDKMLEELE